MGDLSKYVITWIEKHCEEDGRMVRLSSAERRILEQVYGGGGPPGDLVIEDRLAGFVALIHLCSRLAKQGTPPPATLRTDPWTIWRCTGPTVREHLERDGSVIRCRELGTFYSAAAA